jgi:hypothetical protein
MPDRTEIITILQALFGGVLFLMGLMLFFFMQSLSIVILYIAVAILCIAYGLVQMLAAFTSITSKKE